MPTMTRLSAKHCSPAIRTVCEKRFVSVVALRMSCAEFRCRWKAYGCRK